MMDYWITKITDRFLKTKADKKFIEKNKVSHKFPCSSDNCLVRAACTKPCEKLEMDDNKVKKLFEKYNACPDCGSENYIGGPCGGAAQNIKCAGCGHYFNLGLPLFIHRIHVSKEGFRNPW